MIYQLKSNTALKKRSRNYDKKVKNLKTQLLKRLATEESRLESVQPFDKKKPRNTHHKTSDREKLIDA